MLCWWLAGWLKHFCKYHATHSACTQCCCTDANSSMLHTQTMESKMRTVLAGHVCVYFCAGIIICLGVLNQNTLSISIETTTSAKHCKLQIYKTCTQVYALVAAIMQIALCTAIHHKPNRCASVSNRRDIPPSPLRGVLSTHTNAHTKIAALCLSQHHQNQRAPQLRRRSTFSPNHVWTTSSTTTTPRVRNAP